MTNGAKNLVRTLEELAVKYTFGMPGSHLLELTDAIAASSIKNVLVTSELAGAFMADGYARATAEVGVCIAIPGPGLTNMATGLAEAYLDSSPLVAVVIGTAEDGKAYHIHEIEQLEVVAPIVKSVIKVKNAAEIPHALREAFQIARQVEPGPVVVEVENTLLKASAEFEPPADAPAKRELRPENRAKLDEAAKALLGAKQCGLYLGKGAFGASENLIRIAEILSAPVSTTVSGKGAVPEDHDLSVGFGFGPVGPAIAEDVFKKCDAVLAVGCKFSELATGKWSQVAPGTLIHIDASEKALGRNYPASIAICEDAALAAEYLVEQLQGAAKEKNPKLLEKIAAQKAKHLEAAKKNVSGEGIHPSRFFNLLAEVMGGETVVVTDCGNHQLFAISECRVQKPATFMTPADYQAMGFGVPAAVGAAIGRAGQKTVCITGDGGFAITGFEMLTALREKLDLAVFVFDDGALGLIETMQEKFYGRTESVTLLNPDFQKLADAFGVRYITMSNDDQLAAGLKQINENRGVYLVDVKIRYDEWPQYLKGSTVAAWRRLPLAKKLQLIAKRALRVLNLG